MNENKFSPRAEEALRLSQEAAGELGHGYVGTEHLLLGLIREMCIRDRCYVDLPTAALPGLPEEADLSLALRALSLIHI